MLWICAGGASLPCGEGEYTDDYLLLSFWDYLCVVVSYVECFAFCVMACFGIGTDIRDRSGE